MTHGSLVPVQRAKRILVPLLAGWTVVGWACYNPSSTADALSHDFHFVVTYFRSQVREW